MKNVVKFHVKTVFIKLQLEHYMKIVTSLFSKVFPLCIYQTAPSSAHPIKTHNETNETPNPIKPAGLDFLNQIFLNPATYCIVYN